MVNLIGLDLLDEVGELAGDGKIAVVEIDASLGVVEVPVEVVDPVRVEGAGPADQPVDLIALGKEKFRKVRSVLASDAGD